MFPERHLMTMMDPIAHSRTPIFLRIPSEPAPPPIKEPTEPPENPDVPIREPEPNEPAEI